MSIFFSNIKATPSNIKATPRFTPVFITMSYDRLRSLFKKLK